MVGFTHAVGVVDTNESALIARVPVRDLLNPANRHTAYVKRGRITHKIPAFEVVHSHGDARVEFTVWGFTAIVLDKILMRSPGQYRGMLRYLNLRPHLGKQPLAGV